MAGTAATPARQKLPDGFQELQDEVLDLVWTWHTFRQLFTSEEAVRILARAAGSAFRIIQLNEHSALVMRISRLTDKETSGAGQVNLNLAALETWVRDTGDAALADEIQKATEELRDRCADLRRLRNKREAHLDRKVALRQVTLPGSKRENIEAAIEGAAGLMNRVAEHFGANHLAYIALSADAGDGDAILEGLSRGHAHVECEKENWQAAVARRAEDFPGQ